MSGEPDGFYTGPDGKVRPRHDGKGKGAAVVLAIGLAVALGASGAVGLGAASSSADAVGANGAKAANGPHAEKGAKGSSRVGEQDSAKAVARLERQGYRITAHLDAHDGDCAAHAYGVVQQFFREHPCTGLQRALFEVRDKHGDVVLVALAWVEMPDAGRAAELKRLLDGHGTGNLTELSREQGGTGLLTAIVTNAVR